MANSHITNNTNAESLPVMDYLTTSSKFIDHKNTLQHSKSKNQISRYAFLTLLHFHSKEMGYDKFEVEFI